MIRILKKVKLKSNMNPLYITGYTATNCIGTGLEQIWNSIENNISGLRILDYEHVDLQTYTGIVDFLDELEFPNNLSEYDCRNNRLCFKTLQQDDFLVKTKELKSNYDSKRIAVILGTSTSGILSTEMAYRHKKSDGSLPDQYDLYHTHQFSSLLNFTRKILEIDGPGFVISTACSSSAKVFASAWKLIEANICDAAIVGGVDSICFSTLYGFNSLELISSNPCKPFDLRRDGISIGEAGGFAILEKKPRKKSDFKLSGFGESSDAYHMSTPHPEGKGAISAINAALNSACLTSKDIDYINLHGTGTPSNDRSEDMAIYSVFSDLTPCSSTKGWTGHTLGAAGITEAILAFLSLRNNYIPPTLNTTDLDPAFKSAHVLESCTSEIRRVMSNSFGFGGSNCSLIFEKNDQ